MKILAIHNFHRKGSASGDDQVFKNETELLESYGHEIIKYVVFNDEFDNVNIFKKINLIFGMLWSVKHYNAIRKIIKKEKTDVVHVHTFFPLLSPSILYAAKRENVKVVATLHDTRFACPCATSLRNFKVCNECCDGKYFRMCKYRCFKNSRLQSFIVALIFSYHRFCKSFYDNIDKYICLNDNQINVLIKAGFDKKKIIKKYNFVSDIVVDLDKCNIDCLPDRYVVFYGRIGEEKGIRVLMEIWDKITDIPLVVMGDGPLKELFKDWASKKNNVYYLGYTEYRKCLRIVKSGEFVIFPSIWYEGCSMVEIETMSLGKPLIATDLGFSAEAIDDGVNGFKIPLGNITEFINKIRNLWCNSDLCKQMGRNARKEYEKKYLPNDNYEQLIKIYTDLR